MRSLTFGDRTISYDVELYSDNIGMDNHLPISEDDSGTGSVCSEYLEEMDMERERAKKWIQPDILAMTKLLNFEEDDEDDLSDPENEGTTSQKLSVWQKTVMKDLSLFPGSLPTQSRRHSVSLCHASLHEDSAKREIVLHRMKEGEGKEKSTTLSLELEEVKHIRSVLSRARLEVSQISFG